jgi:serine protease Do
MSTSAEAVRATAARTAPSVVRIGRAAGRGAGLVIGGGRVLTNAHNLRDRTTSVTFHGGRRAQGSVVGLDPDGDLVVLAVDTAAAPPVTWGPPPALGDPVFGVANLADGAIRVVSGEVTAVGRTYRGPRGRLVEDAVEHRASLGRGTSGSPLVDTEGRVVAVNMRRHDDGFTLARGITDELRNQVDLLATGRSVTPPRLGIAVTPPEVAQRLRAAVGLDERPGVFVAEVEPDGVGARGGLRKGDVIVRAGDREIVGTTDLLAVLDHAAPDTDLVLDVVRATEELSLAFRLGAPPETA